MSFATTVPRFSESRLLWAISPRWAQGPRCADFNEPYTTVSLARAAMAASSSSVMSTQSAVTRGTVAEAQELLNTHDGHWAPAAHPKTRTNSRLVSRAGGCSGAHSPSFPSFQRKLLFPHRRIVSARQVLSVLPALLWTALLSGMSRHLL